MVASHSNQIVTISFFHFEGLKKIWAFTQMGLAGRKVKSQPGLIFFKMLGTGAGLGFSLKPDFSVYGMLGVWQDISKAHQFFNESVYFEKLKLQSSKNWTVVMQTSQAKGKWDGVSPFIPTDRPRQDAEEIAVLTRATLKKKFLWQFWRNVPQVSARIEQFGDQLLFTKGVGEVPVLQLATFSLWKNKEAMINFAYKDKHHREVIHKTRKLGWYEEELFAEFAVCEKFGSWN